MAQIPYRANLSSATFPMVISKAGRTVITPGADQNFDRRIDPPGDSNVSRASVGIPQAMFMQDVVPTLEGFQSIVYVPNAPNNPPLGGSSVNAYIKIPITTSAGVKQLVRFVFYANATVRSCAAPDITTWAAVTVPGSWTAPADENVMHWGLVQGTAYMLRSDIGKLYTISGIGPVVFTDVTATLTGSPGGISLCGAYNYLIMASFDTIFWSSLTSPVDFVASLISGAGNEAPSGNETTIKFLLPHPAGFLIYTRHNVIAARYTGNRALPWRFIPITDSTEIQSKSYVGYNAESQYHYTATVSGVMQQIGVDGATNILMEVSDYLEKEPYYDVFNSGANTFSRAAKSGANLPVVCRLVLDKYLYISHIQPGGLGVPYKHILIYDTLTRKMGKLVKDHTNLDEEGVNPIVINFGTSGVPDNSFFTVNYNIHQQSIGTYNALGVLLLGRIAYMRDHLIAIESLDIQSVQSDEFIASVDRQFSVFLLLSMDGVNFDTVYVPTLNVITKVLAKYYSHSPATLEVCILIKGAFNVQSISMRCTDEGRA